MAIRTMSQLLGEAAIEWQRAVELLVELCIAVDDARADGREVALEPEVIYVDERPGMPPVVRLAEDGPARPAGDDQGAHGDSAVQLWRNMVARHEPAPRWQPYASPEQLRHASLDGRSDVYTLGVLCHELLTGHLPTADAPGLPHDRVPVELDEVLARCLQMDPAARFADARALARAFAKVPQRWALRVGTSIRAFLDEPRDWRHRLQVFARLCRAVADGDVLSFAVAMLTPDTLVLVGDRCIVGAPLAVRSRNVGEEHVWPSATTHDHVAYASPEQIMGKPRDARSVIYTLGVIGYELFTGQRPFPDARGPAATITAQLKQTPRPPSTIAEVPAEIDAMLLRCLEKNRAARQPDLPALAADVSALAARLLA